MKIIKLFGKDFDISKVRNPKLINFFKGNNPSEQLKSEKSDCGNKYSDYSDQYSDYSDNQYSDYPDNCYHDGGYG
jgi:hypothetical protein